jgi:hypothetical protein
VAKKEEKKKKDDGWNHKSTQIYRFLPRGAHRELSRRSLIQASLHAVSSEFYRH